MGALNTYLEFIIAKKLSIVNEEEIISMVKAGPEHELVSVHKNPLSLSVFPAWARGIIDKGGNLYIAEEVNPSHPSYLIHTDLAKLLDRNGILLNDYHRYGSNSISDYFDDFITVERKDKTNNFLPAESYPAGFFDKNKNVEKLKEYARTFEKKNNNFKMQIIEWSLSGRGSYVDLI